MSAGGPQASSAAPGGQPDDVHAATPSDLPGTDEVEPDPVEVDEAGAENAVRNRIEEFVKQLPDGYCLCPTCLAVGAVYEDPPFDPTTKTCPDCLGFGKTRTGSLVSTQVERDCLGCQGRGWLDRDGGELPASPARASDLDDDVVPIDSHGRTPDDPAFDWTAISRQPIAEPEPAGV